MNRLAVASIGLLVVGLLWGLQTRELPSELPRTSVNYGKDRRTELQLYGSRIGEYRRAPFGGPRGASVRIARVAPRVGDPQDVIETRGLGFLAPMVPYRYGLIVAVVVVCAALLSPLRKTVTSLVLTLYGLLLLSVGLYGVAFGPGPALRHIEQASVGGIVLLPFYFVCWLTFLFAILAGVLVLARHRWAVGVAIGAHAALFLGVTGLLFQAIEARTGYRVERLDWWLYGASFLAVFAVSTWLLRQSRTRRLLGREAAVDDQLGARHEGGLVAGQEQGDEGDLPRLGDPPEGDAGLELPAQLVGQVRRLERGVHDPGMDDVAADAVLANWIARDFVSEMSAPLAAV